MQEAESRALPCALPPARPVSRKPDVDDLIFSWTEERGVSER